MKEKKVFKKLNKPFLFGLIGVFLLVQFLIPLQGHALTFFGLGDASQTFIDSAIKWVLLTIKSVLVSGLMKLAAELTAVSLSLNQTLSANVSDSTSFVYVGWGIFRDLANLGFVFGIILIAIATILRIRSYQAQSILWKLIVAALIVNFSLVICGAILKVSDVFSNFFLQYLTTNQKIDQNSPEQVGSAVVFKIVDKSGFAKTIYSPGSTEDNPVFRQNQDEAALDTSDIVNVFIQVIVAIFISFILLVLAVMFLLRYFNLAFLMILVPGAWLLWIFPAAYRYWREWWEHFIKWTFFAPLMLLFIYLSVVAMDKSSLSFTSMADKVSEAGGSNSITGFNSIMLSLMAGAILIGGLKVSQKMGLAGSSFILKQATKVRGWTQTKATRGAARVGGAAIRPLQGAASAISATKIGRFFGAGYATRGLTRAQATMEREAGGNFRQAKEDYGKLYGGSKERLLGILPTLSGQKKMAVLALLDEKGWLQEAINKNLISVNDIMSYEGVSEKVGVKKEFSGVVRRGKAIGEVASAQENFRSNISLLPTDPARKAAETRLRNAQLELDRQYSDDEWKSQGSVYFSSTLPAGRTINQTLDPNSTNIDIAAASHSAINAARALNSESDQTFLSSMNKLSARTQNIDLVDSMIVAAHQQDDTAIPTTDIFKDIQDARTALLDPTHPDPSKYRTLVDFLANSKNNLHKKVAKRIQETQLSTHTLI